MLCEFRMNIEGDAISHGALSSVTGWLFPEQHQGLYLPKQSRPRRVKCYLH